MAKGDENRARKTERSNAERRESNIMGPMYGERAGAYNRFMTGGYNPSGGGGGGAVPRGSAGGASYGSPSDDPYSNFYRTGGRDAEATQRGRSYIDEGLSSVGNMGGSSRMGGVADYYGDSESAYKQLGNFDPTGISEPLNQYREFATTGGFTPGQISDRRARSNAALPQVYNRAVQDMDRMRAVQGGYSPGYTASRAATLRDAGTAMSDQSRATEADIADSVRSGKMWGTQGIGDTQRSIEDYRQRAVGGSAAGLAGIAGGRTSRDLDVGQYNAGADYRDNALRGQLEAQYRGMGAGNEMDLNRMYQQGRQFGATGMANELGRYDDNLLRGAGIFGNNDMQRIHANKGRGPEWLNAIGNVVGGVVPG